MSKYIDAEQFKRDNERLLHCDFPYLAEETLEELIDNAPAADIPRWIPVAERLPKHEKTRYWICTDTGYQCECRWTDNRFGIGNLSGEWGWSIFDTPQYSKVVAWMPLPEPYKGGEEE